MLKKSLLSFVLSFSMLIPPMTNGESISSASETAGSSLVELADVSAGDAATYSEEASGGAETFSDTSIGNWGMTGDLAGSFSIADDPVQEGNKYLHFYKSEARNTVTTKALGEALPKMESATVAFRWYFGGLVSTNRAGFAGIKLTGGDNELVSLYIGEMRAAGDEAALYYSTGGLDAKVDSNVKVTNGSWYNFEIHFNFAEHTAEILLNNTKIADVQLAENLNRADAFSVVTFDPNGSTKVTPTMGYDDFSFEYAASVSTGSVSTDFQSEESSNWGMTGDLAANVSIVDDSANEGNKYLQLYKSEARTTSTLKSFADMPGMSDAVVDFDWYFGGMVSTSRMGFAGVKLMSGATEVLALYVSDMRNSGEQSNLYYSTNGLDAKVDTGVKVANGSWYNTSVAFDFEAHTAALSVDGTQVAAASIAGTANKIDGFAFVTFDPTGSVKVTPTMGIDDFTISYTESEEEEVVTIYSLDEISNIQVTQEQWNAGYTHPTTVSALLTNGERINVSIDASSWTSAPAFDANVRGVYTWTADIVAPEDYANTNGLQATYKMEYNVPVETSHDYWNDFTFESDIWAAVAWGKGMDSTSGTGYLTLTQETDAAGNGYMKATANAKGSRGSRLDLSGQIIKGAEISFDWMPMACDSRANGRVMFVSTDKWHPYFVLSYDSNYKIIAYTENPLGSCSTTQESFEGSVSEANAIDTGLSGQNKWFTVSLSFDYLAHTADLTVTEKDNPSNSFTRNDIPIETAANGIRAMVISMNKISGDTVSMTMGLDNVAVDYATFTAEEVVSVKKLADVKLAKTQWADYEFPTTAVVVLGDGSTLEVPVGNWTAEPAFDADTEADYVWSAPLVLGELENVYDLSASFNMHYTLMPYPTYVYNPNTLELPFGSAMPAQLPTEVTAQMNNGSIGTVSVGEWTAIRAFNASEEGIYVYGANVVPVEGEYVIVDEALTPNENPQDPSAQREDYVYDVYYRISYFESNDSYNAYQRSMEYLDRGVYAVETEDGVFVSWRLLVTEYGEDISFDVYRNGTKVNTAPVTTRTNLVDAAGKAGDVYTVAKVQNGLKYESEGVIASAENYMSIPLQKPDPQPAKDGTLAAYTINDAGVADVDGDGEYEIIVKWYPDNAFDSGAAVAPSSPTIFDIYEMDGTPLWRLNLGLELPSGAHFNQFMLYDLDEDGKAELFVKTSDGTVSYKPNAQGLFDMTDESTIVSYIGDRSVVPGTNVNSNGHVNANSNEYVTVFNGLTGEEIDTIDYVNTTGEFTDWGTTSSGGNDGGNRSARYNIAVAYLPKTAGSTETIPAVLLNRGYYAKTTVAAYTLRNGELTLEWNFSAATGTENSGKGNHNVSTGDMDKDGFDEIVIGAMAIDHDGSVLWVKNGADGQDFAGHADAIHLAAMNPDNNDLYVFVPAEEQDSTVNHSLSNAATGARLNGGWFSRKDVGRAMAANITPLPGYEYWSAATGSGIYAFDGSVISTTKPVGMNWALYWDGDLLSELGDGIATDDNWAITKYDWVNNTVDTLEVLGGTKTNNSTKKTPSLTADLFGDWREEVVLRNEDDTELRIYMTTEETDYMIYTLMHDPVYRNAVANQNTAYNQPPHIGFYLGEDNADTVLAMELPTANVSYTLDVQEVGVPVSAD